MASREERIRNRLFPGVRTFNRKPGGFTTLPIVLRRAQFLFAPRAWQIYTYILMRTGKSGVAWMTTGEIAHDLDFKSVPKLRLYVNELVAAGWLLHKESSGKDYFIAPDPHRVLRKLSDNGAISDERREEIDDLLDMLDRPTLAQAEAAEKNDASEEGSEDDAAEPAPVPVMNAQPVFPPADSPEAAKRAQEVFESLFPQPGKRKIG